METELQKIEILSEIGFRNNARSISDPDIVDDLKYISLKDIMPYSPTNKSGKNLDGNGFDSFNISIRNQLVKRAASAYLQSATIVPNRNQNCIARFWRNLAIKDALGSCWQIYVRNPLRACAGPICQFLAYLVNQIYGVWSRIAIA